MLEVIKDRILIKQEEVANTTPSGLHLPDSAKEKVTRGKVVTIGPDVQSVKVGAVVTYGKYSGTDINYCGEMFVIIKEDDVLVVEYTK